MVSFFKNKAWQTYSLPLLSFIAVFCLLFPFYGDFFLYPDRFLFAANGDAVKNYYTYFRNINFGNNPFHHEGLNYPFGENVFYTDCHPILVFIMKPIAFIFPYLGKVSIGLMNLFMIYSFPLAAFFYTKIFLKYETKALIAFTGAVLMAYFSPQILRIGGHFALANAAFLPITWYLLIKTDIKQNIKMIRPLLIFNFLFWFLWHAYLGMIAVFFAALLVVSNQLFIEKQWRIKHILILFVNFGLPVFLFQLLVKSSDFHLHRTDNPYGFFEYNAEFETLFIPMTGPLKDFIFKALSIQSQNWEGLAYVGFSTLIVLYISLHGLIAQRIKSDALLLICFLTAIIAMTLAMAYPFQIFPEWLEIFSILKQFRGIGRFAWIFWMLTLFVSFYLLNSWLKFSQHLFYKLLFIFHIVSLFFEANQMHSLLASELKVEKNKFKQSHNFDFLNIKTIEAILPLPYYHIGSENYSRPISDDELVQKSMFLSVQSGLPLLSNYTTRTSLSESKMSMQLLHFPVIEKEIAKYLDATKTHFLIIKGSADLSPEEDYYLSKAQKVGNYEDLDIYLIEKYHFFKLLEIDQLPIMQDSAQFSDPVYYNSFKENKHPGIFDVGAKNIGNKELNVITTLLKTDLEPETAYSGCIWLNLEGKNYAQDILSGSVLLSKKVGSAVEWEYMPNFGTSYQISGNAMKYDFNFKTSKNLSDSLDIIIRLHQFKNIHFKIDHFLIWKSNENVKISITSNRYLVNGYLVED
jgi:hypothetical protein